MASCAGAGAGAAGAAGATTGAGAGAAEAGTAAKRGPAPIEPRALMARGNSSRGSSCTLRVRFREGLCWPCRCMERVGESGEEGAGDYGPALNSRCNSLLPGFCVLPLCLLSTTSTDLGADQDDGSEGKLPVRNKKALLVISGYGL